MKASNNSVQPRDCRLMPTVRFVLPQAVLFTVCSLIYEMSGKRCVIVP